MITITLSNDRGVLDTEIVSTPQAAARTAMEMIRACGELRPGDMITVADRPDLEPPAS